MKFFIKEYLGTERFATIINKRKTVQNNIPYQLAQELDLQQLDQENKSRGCFTVAVGVQILKAGLSRTKKRAGSTGRTVNRIRQDRGRTW